MDDRDPVIEELLQMVRGEYLEMPNLSLAPLQMQRMWAMNDRECTVVIAALVRDQFLYQTPNGHYVRPVLPTYRQSRHTQRTFEWQSGHMSAVGSARRYRQLSWSAAGTPCRSGRRGFLQEASMAVRTTILASVVLCLAAVGVQPALGADTRTTLAIRYEEGKSTDIRLDGTSASPRVTGKAEIEAKKGKAQIELELKDLPAAASFGPYYVTYVVWGITPDGRTNNLGELPWKGDAKLKAELPVQRFALLVTAEPYGAVAQPSPKVVAENRLKPGESVASTGEITFTGDDGSLYTGGSSVETALGSNVPVPVASARLSLIVAQRAGAKEFARGELAQADQKLAQMEAAFQKKPKDEGDWGSFARETTHLAQTARVNAGQRRADVALAEERQTQADAIAKARSQADAALAAARTEQERAQAERQAAERAVAQQRAATAEAEKARLAAAGAQQQANQALQDARTAQQQAEESRRAQDAAQQQAEASRQAQQAALQDAKSAQQQAEASRLAQEAAQQQADASRASAEAALRDAAGAREAAAKAAAERDAARQKLESSLSAILDTRREARGLVVNLGDVLFDTGKSTLRPEAREKLSRLTGVMIAYPGQYTLAFEGHTDSTGSDELNMRLSQARAEAVRDYVQGGGVRNEKVVGTRGFGKAQPVASNDTADGRQRNRRVEIVIDDQSH
jgi:outer membrane protein OmpA-like peptidoglycan-associated protein